MFCCFPFWDHRIGRSSGVIAHKMRCIADTTLVRVPKFRFGSKYSGVLRSPQELKIIGGPTVVRSTPYCEKKIQINTAVSETNTAEKSGSGIRPLRRSGHGLSPVSSGERSGGKRKNRFITAVNDSEHLMKEKKESKIDRFLARRVRLLQNCVAENSPSGQSVEGFVLKFYYSADRVI